MEGDDYEDFVERAASAGDRTPSRETAEHYFYLLRERGYVKGDKMHVKLTRKFADVLIEAVEDAGEHPSPIRKDREVAEGLAWNMARIILQRESGSELLSDMNPEEFARVAQLVVGILRTYVKDPSLLREAIDARSQIDRDD